MSVIRLLKYSAILCGSFMAFAPLALAGAADGGGMPQLNPTTFSSQIFWLLVTFALFYLIISRVAVPRVSSIIEGRENKVSRDLEQASELKRQADDIQQAYESSLHEAREKSQALIRETQELAAQKANAEHSDMSARVQKMLSEHEEKIMTAKEKALSSIQEASAVIAIEAANKIAHIAVNDNEANKAVEKQIKNEVGR